MYEPVKPVILKRNKDDDRPVSGPSVINARSHGVGLLETKTLHVFGDATFVKYFEPVKG